MSAPRYDFRTKRLFVEEMLLANGVIVPDRQQANYLMNVLRLREGEKILLFNGADGEWLGQIKVTGRKNCNIELVEQTREQTKPYAPEYWFAPLKQARLDYMIQKAVEMGVGTLRPVLTQYTQVQKLKTERLVTNATEAAEQCGILNIPTVKPPQKLQAALDGLSEEDTLIFCDELADVAANSDLLKPIKNNRWSLLVGPEGGFSSDEREVLNAHKQVVAISLGPRILRADTAAVAALALIQSAIGDWRS